MNEAERRNYEERIEAFREELAERRAVADFFQRWAAALVSQMDEESVARAEADMNARDRAERGA